MELDVIPVIPPYPASSMLLPCLEAVNYPRGREQCTAGGSHWAHITKLESAIPHLPSPRQVTQTFVGNPGIPRAYV